MPSRLYVGNLSYSTNEDSLRAFFATAGEVKTAEVVMDRQTGRSKGFAFVEMGSPSEVQKAISMFNGYSLDQRLMSVSVARPRGERNGGGFPAQGNYRNNNNDRRY